MRTKREAQTMKAAFSVWDNGIAPVFDVAGQILLVETSAGRIVCEELATMADNIPSRRALSLAELGVRVLVCGAVSRVLQEMISDYGIKVIPFIAGDTREVINAWLSGRREMEVFSMPGCCRGKRRIYATKGVPEEVTEMRGRGSGGSGMGGGRGMGAGRGVGTGRSGGMGGPLAAGPGGFCVCPQCGHKEPHELGVPCMQMACPKCGAAMARE